MKLIHLCSLMDLNAQKVLKNYASNIQKLKSLRFSARNTAFQKLLQIFMQIIIFFTIPKAIFFTKSINTINSTLIYLLIILLIIFKKLYSKKKKILVCVRFLNKEIILKKLSMKQYIFALLMNILNANIHLKKYCLH